MTDPDPLEWRRRYLKEARRELADDLAARLRLTLDRLEAQRRELAPSPLRTPESPHVARAIHRLDGEIFAHYAILATARGLASSGEERAEAEAARIRRTIPAVEREHVRHMDACPLCRQGQVADDHIQAAADRTERARQILAQGVWQIRGRIQQAKDADPLTVDGVDRMLAKLSEVARRAWRNGGAA